MIAKMIKCFMKLHSYSRSRIPVLAIEIFIRRMIAAPKGTFEGSLWEKCLSMNMCETLKLPIAEKFLKNPDSFLRSMAIILKKRSDQEKGVIVISYNYAFPMFLAIFDINKVIENYHIVLEPSWTGYCDSSILSFAGVNKPIFVQSLEPKDSGFLLNVSDNLVPVELGANWWVDHRVFCPKPEIEKDADICMVASWAKFKRHDEVFEVVRKLKNGGRTLRMILIGYPIDLTKDDIYQKAKYRGIEKQVTIYENIDSDEVARQISRTKVNLVWSKREGVNRAIIEGFMCGVPGILREGFNYGHKYNYINEETGMFSSLKELGHHLIHVTDNYQKYNPREWVIANMSCHQACQVLYKTIAKECDKIGSDFSKPIYPKINGLGGMQYFNKVDEQLFTEDYRYLMSCVKHFQ